MRLEWEQSYPNEINDVFDSTGLGIGRMAGWAICNGLNGVPDLRGQFTAMASVNMKNSAPLISSAIPSLSVGVRIGERNNNISINKVNLPNYNMTSMPHTHQNNAEITEIKYVNGHPYFTNGFAGTDLSLMLPSFSYTGGVGRINYGDSSTLNKKNVLT